MVLKESDPALEAGDAAPEFELPGVDGGTYSPSSFDDSEALLVVFTCNHCPYAQAKFEHLNELAASYDDLAVVGINSNDAEEYPDDSFDAMQEYVEEGRVAYDAYLRDESQEVARAYGAVCTPDPFLFRKDEGEFRLVYQGRLDDAMNPDEEATEFYVRDAVESILAGEPVEQEWLRSQGCSIKWRD